MVARAVITGCESLQILNQALEAVNSFKPLTDAERSSLLAKTKAAAAKGEFEPFRTTTFDGTAQNPQWMG
jgi:hypothetical protein